jgi:azurin
MTRVRIQWQFVRQRFFRASSASAGNPPPFCRRISGESVDSFREVGTQSRGRGFSSDLPTACAVQQQWQHPPAPWASARHFLGSVEIMSIRSFGRAVVASAVVACGSVALAAPAGRLVAITGNDQMKFSVMAITAKPGELLHVRLKSVGTLPKIAMAHNFVLLAKGTDPTAFATASATAAATAYIPAQLKAKVLASTALVGPGETVDVTFKAPAAPGKYVYLCSFPGHFVAGMKGVLVVK